MVQYPLNHRLRCKADVVDNKIDFPGRVKFGAQSVQYPRLHQTKWYAPPHLADPHFWPPKMESVAQEGLRIDDFLASPNGGGAPPSFAVILGTEALDPSSTILRRIQRCV